MKYFIEFMGGVPKELEPRVERAISQAAAELAAPEVTPHEALASELESIRKETAADAFDAALGEIRNAVPVTAVVARVAAMAAAVAAIAIAAGTMILNGLSSGAGIRTQFTPPPPVERATPLHFHVTAAEFRPLAAAVPAPRTVEVARAAELLSRELAERIVTVTIERPGLAPVTYRGPLPDVIAALPDPVVQQIVFRPPAPAREWNRTITVTSPVGTFRACCFSDR